ncbi:erythromycin esterase family protein [Gemmatimonas sp.]|uniref:erythromycin esterase family protein n=1 Tax=Gemmatimonas sp. TaxID=1962908 RepID=UPI003F71F04F
MDVDTDDFADLAPLGQATGNARLVLLGEPSHGDGTVVRLRTRIIAYLHQMHGFDVVASESGLFDADLAWQRVRSGERSTSTIASGVHGAWSATAEFQPLAEYIKRSAESPRPLELAGYDSQLSGRLSKQHLIPELRRQLANSSIDTLSIPGWSNFIARLESLTIPPVSWTPVQIPQFNVSLNALTAQFDRGGVTEREQFWLQILRSIDAYAQQSQTATPRGDYTAASSVRDKQMAENLLWLINTRFRGRRVVAWGASLHTAREFATIEPGDPNSGFDRFISMGGHLSRSLGPGLYSIGFVASDGKAGGLQRSAQVLPPITPGSLEDIFRESGFELAFLDLSGAHVNGTWVQTRVVAGPFGYGPMRAIWPSVFDGMIYIRTMQPVHPVNAPTQVDKCRSQVAALWSECKPSSAAESTVVSPAIW